MHLTAASRTSSGLGETSKLDMTRSSSERESVGPGAVPEIAYCGSTMYSFRISVMRSF